jgi:hypothetical protein
MNSTTSTPAFAAALFHTTVFAIVIVAAAT